MDPPRLRPSLLKIVYVRIFTYVVTVQGRSCGSGSFCFFPRSLRLNARVLVSIQDPWSTKNLCKSVDFYSSVFQDFVSKTFLSPNSKAFCLETRVDKDLLVLREIGVIDSFGISKRLSPLMIISSKAHRQPFDDNVFNFEFSGIGGLDRSNWPVSFSSEIIRTVRLGGFLFVLTNTKDLYNLYSFLELFNSSFSLINSCKIDSVDSSKIRQIVLQKEIENIFHGERNSNSGDKCLVLGFKRELICNAEPLIQEEPLKPWLTLKRNINNIKFLTSSVEISFKNRYVYVDVGACSYGSSIVSWFKKKYPKQNKTFEIYAIEADKAFHEEYRSKKRVNLLPYAAWVRNKLKTLFFEVTRDPSKKTVEKGKGMGRIRLVQTSTSYMGDVDKIQAFDFASWLKRTVSEKDFVVMKINVEGTEFHLILRLIKTQAICLTDEMFIKCHYNRWQRCCLGVRSAKYQKTYAQCLDLFTSLRDGGVLVHQWW